MEQVTFFSWKLFTIKLDNGKPYFSYRFNSKEANNFIAKELAFLQFLKFQKIPFRYLKLIPDELPYYFWGKQTRIGARKFAGQVANYFQKIYPKTEIIQFSTLLTNPKRQAIYNRVFNRIYQSFSGNTSSLVDPKEFKKERTLRNSTETAKRAFALFAAETAVLFDLQNEKTFPNLTLLAGDRSINTYKYEFYKFPQNRPPLPKLFVI